MNPMERGMYEDMAKRNREAQDYENGPAMVNEIQFRMAETNGRYTKASMRRKELLIG